MYIYMYIYIYLFMYIYIYTYIYIYIHYHYFTGAFHVGNGGMILSIIIDNNPIPPFPAFSTNEIINITIMVSITMVCGKYKII